MMKQVLIDVAVATAACIVIVFGIVVSALWWAGV